MSNTSPAVQDPLRLQMESFCELVKAVNEIPHVTVDLMGERDSQRDALAFVVDATYRQFKDEDWPSVVKQLPIRVREWNTPKNSLKATSHLLEFIRHLFDCRVAEIQKEITSDDEKKMTEALRVLYQKSTGQLLQKAHQENKDEPVNIGGISLSLLPLWYLNKEYLKLKKQ